MYTIISALLFGGWVYFPTFASRFGGRETEKKMSAED